jgi:hypothetical protein
VVAEVEAAEALTNAEGGGGRGRVTKRRSRWRRQSGAAAVMRSAYVTRGAERDSRSRSGAAALTVRWTGLE